MIDFILSLFFTGPSYVPEIAVEAAYVIAAEPVEPPPIVTGKCCDACKGTGVITHGDGHTTPCKCPPTCVCKRSPKK